jgi:hypothetical protein
LQARPQSRRVIDPAAGHTASRFILPTAMLGGGLREQVRSGQVKQGFGVAGGDLGAVGVVWRG